MSVMLQASDRKEQLRLWGEEKQERQKWLHDVREFYKVAQEVCKKKDEELRALARQTLLARVLTERVINQQYVKKQQLVKKVKKLKKRGGTKEALAAYYARHVIGQDEA